jgi:hypothetical protein
MTKREREAIARKIERLEKSIAKKRDALRIDVSDLEALIESVNDADEETEGVLYHLRLASERLDRGVCDKLSEYV